MDFNIPLAAGQSVLLIHFGHDGAETKETLSCVDRFTGCVGSTGAVSIVASSKLGTRTFVAHIWVLSAQRYACAGNSYAITEHKIDRHGGACGNGDIHWTSHTMMMMMMNAKHSIVAQHSYYDGWALCLYWTRTFYGVIFLRVQGPSVSAFFYQWEQDLAVFCIVFKYKTVVFHTSTDRLQAQSD